MNTPPLPSSLALTSTGVAANGVLAASGNKGAPNKETARSVPAFLNKLFSMVNDSTTDDLIRWSDDGESFFVPSADRFGREVLPRFFKHSNFGSFVRQLNMYGFHKVPHLQQGVLKSDSENELLEFSNPNFTRAQPDLLCLIRRQKARPESTGPETALDLPTLLTDLAAIRKHQTAISADLKDLQTSNHALWQEAIQSRERHTRQQETINKILRFLATVFGGQVVGAEADSPREGGVVEDDLGGKMAGQSAKGKDKEGRVVLQPNSRMRSRLLLEDVKERKDVRERLERDRSTSAGGVTIVDEDEDIEEIHVPRDYDSDIPERSRKQPYTSQPPLSRSLTGSSSYPFAAHSPADTTPSNRFTTLSSGTPTPTPAFDYGDTNQGEGTDNTGQDPSQYQVGLPPDVLSSLLSPSNSNTLAAFLQLQNNGGLNTSSPGPTSSSVAYPSISAPPPPVSSTMANDLFRNQSSSTYLTSPPTLHPGRALLPSPLSTSHTNPLDLLNTSSSNGGPSLSPATLSSLYNDNDPSISADFAQAIDDNNQVISDIQNEKVDLDHRTSALETAIAKLMQALPEETRDQLTNGQDPSIDGRSISFGNTSAGGENEVDIEKFLAQYVNNNDAGDNYEHDPTDYSYLFDKNVSNSTIDPFEIISSTSESLGNNSNNASERGEKDDFEEEEADDLDEKDSNSISDNPRASVDIVKSESEADLSIPNAEGRGIKRESESADQNESRKQQKLAGTRRSTRKRNS